MALNKARMGTSFLTQSSNKRSIALNLKMEAGREALKRLVKDWADVFVENYRPGAFKGLGLGYEDLSRLKPKLVYASLSAFGQDGPRGGQTAYDHAIQASSGITAGTGTEASGPIKVGATVVDYAVGTTGAFALAAALYQTMRTGKGQYIDIAMMDVALMLQATQITDYFHNGHKAGRAGNRMRFAELSMQEASDGLVQLAASNPRQHRRFYQAIGEPDEAERRSLDERHARYDEKQSMIARKIRQKTAQEWEDYLQSKQVPATRVRPLHEALHDPQLKHRGMLHRHENVPGVDGPVAVPLCAFKFAHGGASIERPPPRLGEHTGEILASAGYSEREIAAMRKAGAVA
jgi:crotonobetainyl-CoA:carnitine CoA-transferase CaiB-like acyl-CoA transferase